MASRAVHARTSRSSGVEASASAPPEMSAPHMWSRVDIEFSGDWLSKVAQRQLDVEDCIEQTEDLQALVGLHSGDGAQQSLAPFIFQAEPRDATDINNIKEANNAAEKSMVEEAADSREFIDNCVEDAMCQDPTERTQGLQELRKAKLEDVRRTADRLGEIADVEHSKSQNEVLAAEVDPEELARMRSEDKMSRYKEIRAQRIAQREQTCFDAARALLDSGNRRESLDEVLAQGEVADAMKKREETALADKVDVKGIVDKLQDSMESAAGQLENCKAKKLEVSKELDKKRVVLKEALMRLRDAESEYQDTNIEHESLRLQVKTLERSIEHTADRLQKAQDACSFALAACGCCGQEAATREQEVRSAINAAAKQIVAHAEEPVQVATQNVLVAKEWLALLLKDKDAEIAMLEGHYHSNEDKLRQLKFRLLSMDFDEDVDVHTLQQENARLKDSQQVCKGKIDACRQKRNEQQQEYQKAEEQIRRMHELGQFGCALDHEENEIMEMAKRSYKDFRLWQTAKPRPAALGEQGEFAVSTMPMDIARLKRELMQQVKDEVMQQMQADMLYRKSAGKFGEGQDISDSWRQEGNIADTANFSDGGSTASSMHGHGE